MIVSKESHPLGVMKDIGGDLVKGDEKSRIDLGSRFMKSFISSINEKINNYSKIELIILSLLKF